MNPAYGRDLDLNLLRVFVVVVETGTVTAAASRLYLTQPAVSAALKRLASAVGAPLFARAGRGLALTSRGQRLFVTARAHVDGLVRAALSPAAFDPRTTDRTVRIGFSDAAEAWLLPPLLRVLDAEAPHMRILSATVQFRTVGEALAAQRVDLAITVADELPAGTERLPLRLDGFACLYDPRHVRMPKRLTLERYLAHDHVVVSYNGDLRGVVEDLFGVERKVRVSVPTFANVGALVEGSARLATVPALVARQILLHHPRLRTTAPPFSLGRAPLELVTRAALADDEAVRFVRDHLVRLAQDDDASSPRRRITRQ